MTQVDGVETVRAVRLRPLQRPPVRARPRHAEVGRDRAQRRLGALRQRRARRRRLVLHQGSGRLSRQAGAFHAGRQDARSTAARTTTSGNVVLAGGGPRTQASLFASFGRGPRAAEPRRRSRRRTRPAPRSTRRTAAPSRRSASCRAPLADGNVLRGAFELAHNDIETEAFSSRTVTRRADARVRHRLRRHDAPLARVARPGPDRPARPRPVSWSAVRPAQRDRTRSSTSCAPRRRAGADDRPQRHARVRAGHARRHAAGPQGVARGGQRRCCSTFGGSYKRHTFDMLRDRVDVNADTGADRAGRRPDPAEQVLPEERRRRDRRLRCRAS